MNLDQPAGSFRYDRFVKSSVASKTGGFLSGGKRSVEELAGGVARRVRVVLTEETCN